MSKAQVPLPRTPFIVIRVTSTLLALLGLAQTTFAGSFLNGQYDMLKVHQVNAMVLGGVALIQAITGVLVKATGKGPGWPVWVSLVLVAAIAGQIRLGFTQVLAAHVTLGVLVVAGIVLMAGWAWRTPVPPKAAPPAPVVTDDPVGAAS
ncbi:hypothetical protein [Kitasatospora sp. NPDC056531]|uniref:hypothetical protein n=1 Tax=Kitasatospora sp. NPDC056531 TaxID=3345856 RepID=UPI00368017FB